MARGVDVLGVRGGVGWLVVGGLVVWGGCRGFRDGVWRGLDLDVGGGVY